MPYKCAAVLMEDSDGDYNIYVNDYLSDEALQRKIKHELRHIENGDAKSDECFSVLETAAE
jgi:TnpA family transposase